MQKQFKAESKRLLDLMIHSIYTHKEIFLRELISNASDANDKLNYLSIQQEEHVDRSNLKIRLLVNKEGRYLEIQDSGIGMTQEELEENLGTIAKSGSFAFKEALDQKIDDIDVIGQFGVGFYSSFMVASKVEVETRKYNETKGYRWTSEGNEGFTIEEIEKNSIGTTLRLFIKENSEDENYDEYVDQNHLQSLVHKYSDYIRYPIVMNKEVTTEESTMIEEVVLNSMVPLWKKAKSEVSEEEYNEFYMSKFHDYSKPFKSIRMEVEGNVSFTSLLFIPSVKPYNFYQQEYEKGLQLYSRGVFIMDKATELVPEHFRFVKGLVDSQDLSLNISRELLQHDRQLKVIASRIEKKIKSELTNLLSNERVQYEEFWKNFGLQLKFGVYNDFGAHKETLQDLLLFTSSKEQKLITLKEYVDQMKEEQEYIYYASGESFSKIEKLPQVEKVVDKGFEVLFLGEHIDEFALQAISEYQGKSFKNVSQGDLGLDSEEEKKELEEKTKENVHLLDAMKEALGDAVSKVQISTHLKSHPVCLVSDEGLSFEMEKVLAAMPDANLPMKATRILEINAEHPIFRALQKMNEHHPEKIELYAQLLYNQALLIEGFPIEDPLAFSNQLCELMVEVNKLG